jgi:hypothetical protein
MENGRVANDTTSLQIDTTGWFPIHRLFRRPLEGEGPGRPRVFRLWLVWAVFATYGPMLFLASLPTR